MAKVPNMSRFVAAAIMAATCFAALGADLLPANRAFQIDARQVAPDLVEFEYRIAGGYALYPERFKPLITEGPARVMSTVVVPLDSKPSKNDLASKEQPTYLTEHVVVRVRLTGPQDKPITGQLQMMAQGCAIEAGVCYPPVQKTFLLGSSERQIADQVQKMQSTRCAPQHSMLYQLSSMFGIALPSAADC